MTSKYYLKLILKWLTLPLLKEIHQYRNIHSGEKCYLMGDGESIKWFDLSAFSDKTAIPCSYIPFHNDFNKLNVSYLSLIEPWWFYPFIWTTSEPIKLIRNYKQKLYVDEVIKKHPKKIIFTNISNIVKLHGYKNVVYNHELYLDESLPSNFISNRINCYADSFRWSLLLAIYMGFDHAYMLGFDYTHSPTRDNHWYEKGQATLTYKFDYQKDFIEIAKEFIDITVITLDGKSEHLNYQTYEQFTGLKPVYKENYEIIDNDFLQKLKTWPGYNI